MSSREKCLFLWLNDKEFHAMEASKRAVEVAQVYKQHPTIMRAIRRIYIELNIPWISPWIASWKKKLRYYEVIIIHASKITPPVVKFIKRKCPNIRIIVWYWNPTNKCVSLDKFSNKDCEIWSFDEGDCAKYDVLFVGGDKGRIKKLVEIQRKFNELEVSSYFYITPTGKVNEAFKEVYKERISYPDILNYISESKAILDYVSENHGLFGSVEKK